MIYVVRAWNDVSVFRTSSSKQCFKSFQGLGLSCCRRSRKQDREGPRIEKSLECALRDLNDCLDCWLHFALKAACIRPFLELESGHRKHFTHFHQVQMHSGFKRRVRVHTDILSPDMQLREHLRPFSVVLQHTSSTLSITKKNQHARNVRRCTLKSICQSKPMRHTMLSIIDSMQCRRPRKGR
jgi:hypothetical protein